MRRFLRLPQVMDRVAYSRATIYRRIDSGSFPAPYSMDGNGRSVAWLESEIEAWIAERVERGARLSAGAFYKGGISATMEAR